MLLNGHDAMELEDRIVLQLLEHDPNAVYRDLGCGNGARTLKFAQRINTKNVWGVDIDKTSLDSAKKRGVPVLKWDLNQGLPWDDSSIDVITAP